MSPQTSRVASPQPIEAISFNRYARTRVLWYVCAVFALAAFAFPVTTSASSDAPVRATVRSVVSEQETIIPGTETRSFLQVLEAETEAGAAFTIENDRVRLSVGDAFFVFVNDDPDLAPYVFYEPDRRALLLFSVALFVIVTVSIGRMVGVRALASLVLAGVVIFYFLLPQLASGATPLVVSVGSAIAILGLAMGITHGLSRTTLAAFIASVSTIVFAALLGNYLVEGAHLSGFVDDASVVLNFTTGGTLNLSGILLAAIIIGTLGIIDDLAMTQVSAVSEIHRANNALSKRELYRRAMRVGREHLGAVTNTLLFAYAGASLPLLLLFTLSPASPLLLINGEVVAVEIVRAAVGGTALALVLPVATVLGILAVRPRDTAERNG